MLKMALFKCAINEKCCSVDKGWAFALFFHPHPTRFDSSRVSTTENLPSKANKMPMPRDQPGSGGLGGGGRVGAGCAGGIDWCINYTLKGLLDFWVQVHSYILTHVIIVKYALSILFTTNFNSVCLIQVNQCKTRRYCRSDLGRQETLN